MESFGLELEKSLVFITRTTVVRLTLFSQNAVPQLFCLLAIYGIVWHCNASGTPITVMKLSWNGLVRVLPIETLTL